jgi:hypothetical protein
MMLAARLIPAADRDAIVGDLLEECRWRGIKGTRLSWWIARECVAIAAGLTVERARAACSPSLVREVVSGIAASSEHVLRTPVRRLLTRAALFTGGVILLACSVEILVGALLRSAGL